MWYAAEMASDGMIHLSCFMTISSDAQAIKRFFCLSILRAHNVDNTDGKDL
jgi:hypothetical protein